MRKNSILAGRQGFSLIELIVVMTIIMVITVVGMVSFSGANRKARDNKRISDLEKVRIALEIYKQQTGGYPIGSNFGQVVSTLNIGGYLQGTIVDPVAGRNYYYRADTGYQYCMHAALENVPSDSGSCQAGFSGVCGSVACNYIVGNP